MDCKPQKLRQLSGRDCGVEVFSELAGSTRSELLNDLPSALDGTVRPDQWEEWLSSKGFTVTRHEGCEQYDLPCAHLVGNHPMSNSDFHWVYRDPDGDIHDPSPVLQIFCANDSKLRSLSFYDTKVLTISVKR